MVKLDARYYQRMTTDIIGTFQKGAIELQGDYLLLQDALNKLHGLNALREASILAKWRFEMIRRELSRRGIHQVGKL